MIALNHPGLRRAVLALGSLMLLAGCAENSPLMAHEPAAQPACDPAAASPPMGCVNRANLAAMVVNPGDLARAAPESPASGATQANAVEAYKKGQIKKSTAPATSLGVFVPSSSGSPQ